MTTHSHPLRHNQPVNDGLHPLVYKSLVGLAIWFVLSVWVLFNRGAYTGLNIAIITLFFFIAVAIPVLLWLTWRRNTGPEEQSRIDEPFHDWASHSFVTWTGGVSGKEAATQILLPIAAVALGITIFGLVFLFAVPQLGGY
jgi:Mn2+/Fe2+ NRAMP family transporter